MRSINWRCSAITRGAVVGEAQDYLPQMQHYNAGPEAHVEFLSDVKRELSIPVIASLNGGSPGSWLRYARLLESAVPMRWS